MANSQGPFNQQELQFLEQLRTHPELFQRLREILNLAENRDHPLRTADQLEGLLIEELRRLGKTTMESWATHAEERIAIETKQQDPSVRYGKKKR